jgi:hypothetical protein
LGTLAKEFKSGDARRNPKHLMQTCDRCVYGNLCRIQPEKLQPEGDEDE